MLGGLFLLPGCRAQSGLATSSKAEATTDWRKEDYSEVFRPVLQHYGPWPLSKDRYLLFGTESEFNTTDSNHDGKVDEKEFIEAFMATQEGCVDD